MRGRKPKPTKRLIAEGDPGKRGPGKLREKLDSEPHAPNGLPACPRHLRGRARAAWNFWAKQLELMDLDAKPDAQMLEGACVGYERAVAADLILQKDGLIVEERAVKGDQVIVLRRKKHPAVEVSRTSWLQVRAFCTEFGLSPVSRTRLSVEKPENSEMDLIKLLATPRASRSTQPVN